MHSPWKRPSSSPSRSPWMIRVLLVSAWAWKGTNLEKLERTWEFLSNPSSMEVLLSRSVGLLVCMSVWRRSRCVPLLRDWVEALSEDVGPRGSPADVPRIYVNRSGQQLSVFTLCVASFMPQTLFSEPIMIRTLSPIPFITLLGFLWICNQTELNLKIENKIEPQNRKTKLKTSQHEGSK